MACAEPPQEPRRDAAQALLLLGLMMVVDVAWGTPVDQPSVGFTVMGALSGSVL
jgi:hypothetical protein